MEDLEVVLNKVEIERKTEARFLGVIVDERLKWTKHIEAVKSKTSKYIRVMYKLKYLTSVSTHPNFYFQLPLSPPQFHPSPFLFQTTPLSHSVPSALPPYLYFQLLHFPSTPLLFPTNPLSPQFPPTHTFISNHPPLLSVPTHPLLFPTTSLYPQFQPTDFYFQLPHPPPQFKQNAHSPPLLFPTTLLSPSVPTLVTLSPLV